MLFADKIVLVTGAGWNTGLEIASRFVSEGATVFVHDRSAEDVHHAANELRSRGLERFIEVTADLGDPAAVERLFTDIHARTGRLDVLVNNAAVKACGYSFEDMPLGLFEAAIRVNLIGLFHVAREAARMMIAQGAGAIVNIGSCASTRAIRNRSAYVASKGGVDALTRAMALDLGSRGVRVNSVTPGYVHTGQWGSLPEQDVHRRRSNIPLGKEATGSDVAAAVLFLASDEASNIHGASLVVDGGISAQHVPSTVDV